MLAARAVIIKIRFILPIKQPALYFHCRKPPTLNINKAFQLLIWLETNIQPTSTSTEHLVQHFFTRFAQSTSATLQTENLKTDRALS